MSELARKIIEEVCHMVGGPLPTDSEGINEVMGDCEVTVDALLAPDPWPLVRELRDAAEPFTHADSDLGVMGPVTADEIKKLCHAWKRATAALKRREGVGT